MNLTVQEERNLNNFPKEIKYNSNGRNEYFRNYMKNRRKNKPELKEKHTQYIREWRRKKTVEKEGIS